MPGTETFKCYLLFLFSYTGISAQGLGNPLKNVVFLLLQVCPGEFL